MAKYRTIQPEFWSDPYIEELSAYGKLLYLYLFTSQYTRNTGALQVTTRKIAFETGITVEDVEAVLSGFERDGKIIRDGAQIWVINFIKNQTTNSPKIIANLREELREITSQKILAAMRERYPQLFNGSPRADTVSAEKTGDNSAADTVSIPYQYTTDTVPIHKEDELEDELESKGEKEKEYSMSLTGHVSVSAKKPVSCPCEQIVEAYSAILPGLLPVQRLTDARRKALAARWREDKERQTLSWWNDYFERVRASDFLMGRCPPTQGRATAWQADFDWLLKPANLQKVVEGKYDNHTRAAPQSFEDALKDYSDPFGLFTEEKKRLNDVAVEVTAEEEWV